MTKYYTDLMFDAETFSVNSNAGMISIGAVLFNVAKGIEDRQEFKMNINLQEIIDNPRFHVSSSTLAWWITQNSKAFEAATTCPHPLYNVLFDFNEWLRAYTRPGKYEKQDVRIWSNGAGSDLPWLRNAYETLKLDTPWLFYNERCYRTVKAMSQVQMQRVNDHDALSDARNQAHHLCEIFATEGFEIW